MKKTKTTQVAKDKRASDQPKKLSMKDLSLVAGGDRPCCHN